MDFEISGIAEEGKIKATWDGFIDNITKLGGKFAILKLVDVGKQSKKLVEEMNEKRATLVALRKKLNNFGPPNTKEFNAERLEYEAKAYEADAAATRITAAWCKRMADKKAKDVTDDDIKYYCDAIKRYNEVLDSMIDDLNDLCNLAKEIVGDNDRDKLVKTKNGYEIVEGKKWTLDDIVGESCTDFIAELTSEELMEAAESIKEIDKSFINENNIESEGKSMNAYEQFLSVLEEIEQSASSALESAGYIPENSDLEIAEESVITEIKASAKRILNKMQTNYNLLTKGSEQYQECKELRKQCDEWMEKINKAMDLDSKLSEYIPPEKAAKIQKLIDKQWEKLRVYRFSEAAMKHFNNPKFDKEKPGKVDPGYLKAYKECAESFCKQAAEIYAFVNDILAKTVAEGVKAGVFVVGKKEEKGTESVTELEGTDMNEVTIGLESIIALIAGTTEEFESYVATESNVANLKQVKEELLDEISDLESLNIIAEESVDGSNKYDEEIADMTKKVGIIDEKLGDEERALESAFANSRKEIEISLKNIQDAIKQKNYAEANTKITACLTNIDSAAKTADNESDKDDCEAFKKRALKLQTRVTTLMQGEESPKEEKKEEKGAEGVETMLDHEASAAEEQVEEMSAVENQTEEAAAATEEETTTDPVEEQAEETKAEFETPDVEEIEVPDENVLTAGNESLLLLDCLYATSTPEEFKNFLSENKVELELYGLVDTDAIARESWADVENDESEIATEARNIVRLNREAQISRETARIAIGLAKQANDTLYKYYHKYSSLKREFRDKIYAKYGQRAQALARRSLSNSRAKASLMNSKTGSSIVNKIDSRIKQLDSAGRNKEAIQK